MVRGNSVDFASDGDEGDHIIDVATSAGTIAAALNAEFERDRCRRLPLGLGLGEGVPLSEPAAVDGRR